MRRVEVMPIDPRRLEPLIGGERVASLIATADALTGRLDGRRLVNVNSTATGGGVAELLQTLVGYALGVGIDCEWRVIDGDPRFFHITKRVHNGLYGSAGDGGELGAEERAVYEETVGRDAKAVASVVRPGDVVIVHDPQPAPLIPPLLETGAIIVWRCHVGLDGTNEWTDRAWEFLRPYVAPAHAYVFSREAFAPGWIDGSRVRVIPPSIDPFTSKNLELGATEALGLLASARLVEATGVRPDHRVSRTADVIRESSAAPKADVPLVVQVSRWDRMKDMTGVLDAFVEYVPSPAHLVLAGPEVAGVSDDPEGAEVWAETAAAWAAAPAEPRSRVHLAALPMEDPVENALVVNALQRHACVVTQKSLAEGFGLTVAEAMWKSRPVVASAVGGIVDQIRDGETGRLVGPHDLAGFGEAVSSLLADRAEAERLGRNARAYVTERFLADRHLLQYAELVGSLLEWA